MLKTDIIEFIAECIECLKNGEVTILGMASDHLVIKNGDKEQVIALMAFEEYFNVV